LQASSTPQRSRPRCRHRGRLGETSQPGFPCTCRCTSAEPGPDASENIASGPLPQGRHRTFRSRSFALRHGSCLLPLKLPSILTRTTPFSVPPAARILSRLRGHRRPSGASQSEHSIRADPSPFSPSGCDTGTIRRLFVRPKPSGIESTHWLTVATIGLDRLCSPTRSETTDPGASLGFAVGFPNLYHLFVSRHRLIPLAAWLPGCITERNNPPRGSR
jgi:hypothetical protein